MNSDDSATMIDSEDAKVNHDRFIAALDKHGYGAAPAAWAYMAGDLAWSTEEVKLYAYRYFITLLSVEESHDDNGTTMHLSDLDNDWTHDEVILLEALLVQHLPLIIRESEGEEDWERRIASQIPGKTALQVRQMYEKGYRKLVKR
jgi:hypothetical protein